MKAIVVFQGEGLHILAGWLKEGFSHVAVIVETTRGWVLIDPGIGTPDIRAIDSSDVVQACKSHGWTVCETETRYIEATSPFMLNNCVGVVKKILGIRAPFVWTPYQLYRYLEKH